MRILRAASELFAQRGPDASMPELAERAGVGVGSLYRAFGDKETLLGAVMAERMRVLVDAAVPPGRLSGRPSPCSRLRQGRHEDGGHDMHADARVG